MIIEGETLFNVMVWQRLKCEIRIRRIWIISERIFDCFNEVEEINSLKLMLAAL